jgi:quercetin dioxygenase-like cupin family protein
MKQFATIAATVLLLASEGAHANPSIIAQAIPADSPSQAQNTGELRITRVGSLPSTRGSAETFTGAVRNDRLFNATAPSRMSGASVTFEPGARSAWHTYPVGQVLVVTAGVGWVQRDGGPVEEMRPGDVVWIPAGLKHWHGATATTGVTHIALQEHTDGQVVDWMEKVSDGQYRR